MFELVLATAILSQDRYADTDSDGLLDVWEREGFGPIDPKVHGCLPGRADVFVVFRIRSKMTQEKIRPTIDRMKKFYASMPFKNPDGSMGLNMIAVVPPPMPEDTDKKGYIELYEQAMPFEWRGLAHGVLVDDHPGGGGQCNRPDWCGAGYNWHTILHEIGHQFGLPHDPVGARTGSPFHRSMMNYDYSYQLGGDGEAIIFSDGRFAGMRMKETALEELVPYPLESLKFLSNRPYFFKLEERGPAKTAIDWNRNGVFGESKVRADVNDGYAVALREGILLERTAGAASMASLGEALAVVYPDFSDPKQYEKFELASLSKEYPGSLKLLLVRGKEAGKPIELVHEGVTGDPSVLARGREIWVAFPTAAGVSLRSWTVRGGVAISKWSADVPVPGSFPTLVSTPNGTLLLSWNPADGSTSIGDLRRPAELRPLGLVSQHPVGAVWNSRKGVLAVASTERQNNFDGRIRITEFVLKGSEWKQESMPIWVEGEKGGARTSARPILIFDSSRDAGPNGAYTVYVKGQYPDPNQQGVNFSCRQIADQSHSGGWRVKMMGNEWALSRSVCSVTPHRGDVAYIYRWAWGENNHKMILTRRASGIEDEWLTDFDEVGYIFREGLKRSLQQVRDEQWRRKR